MKITITFNELDQLHNGLKLVENLRGMKFAYCVAKNKRLIEQELKILEDILKSTNAFREYETKRIQVCEKNCVKDPSGKPILDKNGNFDILNKASFDSEMNPLMEQYKDTIDHRKKQVDEFQEMMGKQVEVEVHQIKLEDIPQDITPKQMDIIMPLVKE
jgi:hypothetical protein